MNDLRYAVRMLVKNRGLAAAAIVSLGLGIAPTPSSSAG